MFGRPLYTIFAVASGVALLAGAEPYRDAEHHFTVSLPEGWVVMDPAVVNAATQLAKTLGQKVRYLTGFQPEGQKVGEDPYVLVHVREARLSGATYEEIEESMRGTPEQIAKVKGLMLQPSGADARLDRKRNRVVVEIRAGVMGLVRMQGTSFGLLGADGIVFLHCYAPEAQFDAYRPTFDAMVNSFRFDKGYEFVPSSSKPGSDRPFRPGLLSGDLAILVIVVVLVALLYGFRWALRRLKRPAQPTQ